jgi:3',5'-cyclic AMP phosphodiesterase CpdA
MFVLAHLSDPHIGPLPRPRLRDLTSKRMVGYANWWRSRARVHRLDVLDALTQDLAAQAHDHTAVTGDLVNIALPGEFAQAQAWLDRLGVAEDVTFVPGNHDAYVHAALSYWDRHWDAFMRGDEDAGSQPGGLRFPFVRRRGPVVLIGLSTAVPTLPVSAAGRLGVAQIERLTELLRGFAGQGLFRIVLIHHPPRTPLAYRLKRLTDGADFRHAIARAGAELVLHGHIHKHVVTWLDGPDAPVPVIGVPSASAVPGHRDDPAAYNLYRITGKAGDWTCEVVSRGLSGAETGIGEIGRFVLSAPG